MPDKLFAIQAFYPIVQPMQQNPIYPASSQSATAIFRRLLNFVLALLVGIVIGYLWLNNVIQNDAQLQRQADQLGRTLISQHASLLAGQLAANDMQRVTDELNILRQDPHIHGVALFNEQGSALIEDEQSADIRSLFNQTQAPDLLVYVQTIVQGNQQLGFLRITLWRDKVVHYYQDFQRELLLQAGLLMALSLLAGVLLTRGFYQWRGRKA